MAKIFPRKDGRYQTVVYVPDPNNPYGPKIPKYLYDRDRQMLKIKANEIENRVYKKTYADAGNLTVGEYLDNWFKIYCKELAETTHELYKMYISVHIKPKIGMIKLNDILPMHLQDFYNKKMDDEYDDDGNLVRKKLMGKTVLKLNTLLNRAFKDAVSNNLMYKNPCDSIKKPKKEDYEPNVYNEKEMGRLLDIVEGTYDEIYIVLAAYVGLRRGEIMGLRWKNIDFANQTISIEKTITRFNKNVEKDPKSKKSKRTIVVRKFVLDLLANYRKSLKIVGEYVCDQYKPQSYSEHFSNLLKYNNLPHIRFHDLRHYTGTIMTKYGVPDKVQSEVLGHSTVKTTRIYQHAQDGMLRSAAQVMEKSYKKSKKAK